MIRSEIIQRFRDENTEFPERVISTVTANSWLFTGDKEFCAETRCIVDQDGTTISTTLNDQSFDLTTEISKFYDIDDYPGSGVLYNGKRLEKTTMASLDQESAAWRDRAVGTPKKWYRRGNMLYLDRPIDSAADDLIVYSVLVSDDWSSDVEPFNALAYLEPFHYAMVLYLVKRAKSKVGKPEEAMAAQAEYNAYIAWVKRQLGGNKYAPVYFQKKG